MPKKFCSRNCKGRSFLKTRAQAGYMRNAKLRSTYGITAEQWQEMFEAQGGVCAICRMPAKGKRPLAVDHDHTTKRVRGLVCYGCNRMLAAFDSPLRESIERYLVG